MKDLLARVAALPSEKKELLRERLDRVAPLEAAAADLPETHDARAGLAAYLVARGSARPDAEAMRRYLKEKLPEYMLPSSITWVEALPRTTSGKINKRALPDPVTPRSSDASAPTSRAEATLRKIWEDVLGVDSVGVDENFFELGGDSLLSIRILSRASQAGLTLTPKQFFDHPTVAGIAALFEGETPSLESELGSLEAGDAEALLSEVEKSSASEPDA